MCTSTLVSFFVTLQILTITIKMSPELMETVISIGAAAVSLLEDLPEERRLSRRTGTVCRVKFSNYPLNFQPMTLLP